MSELPKEVISLVGPNSYLLEKKLRFYKENFIKKYSDIALEIIDAEEAELEQIIEGAKVVPFLSPKKLLIIKNAGQNKSASSSLEDILSKRNATTILIFVEPSPDKRSSYYKNLRKFTNLEEFKEIDMQSLAKWIVSLAQGLGGEISFADANYLIDRVGTNQQNLSTEITKLANYNPKVSKSSIELLTVASPQGTIFNLLDSAFAGNQKKALAYYAEQRAQKIDPAGILAMIVWQLNIIAIVKSSKLSVEDLSKECGLHPFVLEKASIIAKRLSKSQLIKILDDLCILDEKRKTKTIDIDEALKQIILELGLI